MLELQMADAKAPYALLCANCGGVAYWATNMLTDLSVIPNPNDMRHLDGREVVTGDTFRCGSCGSRAGLRACLSVIEWKQQNAPLFEHVPTHLTLPQKCVLHCSCGAERVLWKGMPLIEFELACNAFVSLHAEPRSRHRTYARSGGNTLRPLFGDEKRLDWSFGGNGPTMRQHA